MLNYVPEALTISKTKHPANRSINHTHTSSPTTGQRCSTRKTRTPWHFSPKKTGNSFKRSSALASIMRNVLPVPCLQHWGLLPHNRQTQPRTQWKRYNTFRLCLYSSWCNLYFPCKWHGPHGTQWRIVPLWIKGVQLGRQTFLHVQQHCQTTKQWHHPHYCTDYQGGVIGGRGWGGGSLHQLQRSHSHPLYPQIHGPSPISDPNADGQHHCTRRCQQQCYQEIESNGHEIPLALQQRMSRTILTILGTRQRKQRQLHDNASCRNWSPSNGPNFPYKYLNLTSTTQKLTGNLLVARVC